MTEHSLPEEYIAQQRPVIVMSPDEKTKLAELTRSNMTMDQMFPMDGDPMLFMERVHLLAKGFASVRDFHNRVKMMLGRAMLVASKRPDVYQSAGFRRFEDLVGAVSRTYFISRSEIFKAKALAVTFPDLTPNDFAAIGITKLAVIAQALTDDVTEPGRQYLIEKAKTTQYKELIKDVQERYHFADGDLELGVVTIVTSRAILKRWNEFIKDPKVAAFFGTEKAGGILAGLLDVIAVDIAAVDGGADAKDGEVIDVSNFDELFEDA